MFVFSAKSEKERYLYSQLHLRLGINFIEDLFFSFSNATINKSYHSIIITNNLDEEFIEEEKKTIKIIKSNILNLISNNLMINNQKSCENKIQDNTSAKIDEEILLLKNEIVQHLEKKNFSFEYKDFSENPIVCLSHDVDSLKGKSVLRAMYWIFFGILNWEIKKNLLKIYKIFSQKIDYLDSLEFTIELEKKYGFSSTYYFLSLPFFLSYEGRRYRVTKKKYREKIKKIIKSENEIGLHTSRLGFKKENLLRKELKRLNKIVFPKKILGVRNHYLSGKFSEILERYEKVKLSYDSSLGWSDRLGYRAGTSSPFRAFDEKINRACSIVELPLIIMDTAIDKNSAEGIFQECKPYFKKAIEQNSVVSLLWHTDRIFNPDYPHHTNAYPLILNFLKENNFYSMTAIECVDRFKKYESEMKKNLKNLEDV